MQQLQLLLDLCILPRLLELLLTQLQQGHVHQLHPLRQLVHRLLYQLQQPHQVDDLPCTQAVQEVDQQTGQLQQLQQPLPQSHCTQLPLVVHHQHTRMLLGRACKQVLVLGQALLQALLHSHPPPPRLMPLVLQLQQHHMAYDRTEVHLAHHVHVRVRVQIHHAQAHPAQDQYQTHHVQGHQHVLHHDLVPQLEHLVGYARVHLLVRHVHGHARVQRGLAEEPTAGRMHPSQPCSSAVFHLLRSTLDVCNSVGIVAVLPSDNPMLDRAGGVRDCQT